MSRRTVFSLFVVIPSSHENSMICVIGLQFCPFDFTYQFWTWLSPFTFVNHGHLYFVS